MVLLWSSGAPLVTGVRGRLPCRLEPQAGMPGCVLGTVAPRLQFAATHRTSSDSAEGLMLPTFPMAPHRSTAFVPVSQLDLVVWKELAFRC